MFGNHYSSTGKKARQKDGGQSQNVQNPKFGTCNFNMLQAA
jgi:hypothetical protein